MSLTQSDLQEIRTIVRDEVRTVVDTEVRTIVHDEVSGAITPLTGKIEALENDIKEIYHMLARIEKAQKAEKEFLKLDLEKKILTTYKNLQLTAEEAGVTLPRP